MDIIKLIAKSIIANTTMLLASLAGYSLIVCPRGIGDTLFVSMCMREYKKKNGCKVLVICQKYTSDICRQFPDIDIVIGNNYICKAFSPFRNQLEFSTKMVYAHTEVVNDNRYHNIIDRYAKGILKLNKYEVTYPQVTEKEDITNTTDFGNAIILSPYANSSIKKIDGAFWKSVAELLVDKGYTVYTNCGNSYESEIPGTKRLEISFVDLYIIAKKSKAFIAWRSGICDWIALSGAKMIVINDPMWGREWDLNNFSKGHVIYYQYDSVDKLDTIKERLIKDIMVD